jgi:DeoR family suf operon transcriptional repressor
MRATVLAQSQPTTRKGILAILLRLGEATAHDIARRLEISVQATRRHLRGLEDDGLVEGSSSAEGPGRPSYRWQLTSKGHAQFADGSESFALTLLESLSKELPREALQALLKHQALQQAAQYRERLGDGPLEQRVARLVELRKAEGYVAECDLEADGWVIREFHCSVMRIAEQFPCVCDQELQLIRHTFPDCQVERVHWRLEAGHSCGFRLTPLA